MQKDQVASLMTKERWGGALLKSWACFKAFFSCKQRSSTTSSIKTGSTLKKEKSMFPVHGCRCCITHFVSTFCLWPLHCEWCCCIQDCCVGLDKKTHRTDLSHPPEVEQWLQTGRPDRRGCPAHPHMAVPRAPYLPWHSGGCGGGLQAVVLLGEGRFWEG